MLRYFIQVDGDKVTGTYCGPFTNEEVENILKDGYTEVDAKYAELLSVMQPLIYKNGKLNIDTAQQKLDQAREDLNNQLSFIYGQLQSTDYVACKIIEGVATKEEYQDILNQRIEWRNQINELQKEIDKLK